MGIRDDELARLIKYANGMGVQVRFKPYIRGSGNAAEWSMDGSEITLYTTSKDTKIGKILNLIHEIAHHRGFIENGRKLDLKVVEALEDEEEKKKSRRRIYLDEAKDTKYWEQIYRDTDCQFDIKILHMRKEFDTWQYLVYYETGKFPTGKEKKIKNEEIKEMYDY